MGDTLCHEISLFIKVSNENEAGLNPPRPTYHVTALGGYLQPQESDIDPGAQEVTRGSLSVPNAFLGAQGTYGLDDLVWIVRGKDLTESNLALVGKVTYVTDETPEGIITTQTLSVTPRATTGQIPVNAADLSWIPYTPNSVMLSMVIECGTYDDDDEAGQATIAQMAPVEFTRVIKQKKTNVPVEGQE